MRQLNQAEEAFTIVNEVYPFTLVCALRLKRSPGEKAVGSALKRLQSTYPFLSVYITKNNGKAWFAAEEKPVDIPLEIIRRKGNSQWEEEARWELNTGFDHRVSPLMRAKYLVSDPPEGDAEIIFSFHHAIIDAVSFLPMVERFLGFLGDEKNETGTGTHRIQETMAASPLLKNVLPGKFKGPGLWLKLLHFMARQMADEYQYKKSSVSARDSSIPSSPENGLLVIDFSEEETNALVRWSRTNRITINSLITATMLKVINDRKYDGKKKLIRAVQFANLRPYLKPPVSENGAGCFIAMMRYTARISVNDDIPGIASFLDNQFKKSASRGDKFLYALLSKMLVKQTIKAHNARLGAVALSYAGVVGMKEDYGKVRVKNIHAYISNNPLGAEISAFGKIYFGKLSLDFNYLLEETSREEAMAIADEIKVNLLKPGN
jgi:hypothetical protein